MTNNLIILLITSIILVIISTWNLTIFITLKNTSNDIGESSCNFSKKYIMMGHTVSKIILLVSVLIMIYSSFYIYLESTKL